MFSYLMVIIMLLIGVVPMLWEIYTKRFDFFNLKNPFIIYYVLQLGISGLVTFVTGQANREIGLDPFFYSEAYSRSLFLSIVGLMAFQFGYYTQKSFVLRLPVLFRSNWKGERFIWLTLLYFLIGAIAFWIFLRVNGGLSAFLMEREAWRTGGLIGQGILMFPASTLLSIAAVIYFIGTIYQTTSKALPIKCILLFGLALVPPFFMGFRSAIGLPVLQFLVVWNYGYKKISTIKLVLFLALLAIGFTLYGISRELPTGVDIDTSAFIETAIANPELIYAVISRSKGTEVVAAVINRLDQTGEYDYGWRSLLEAITIVIPKTLWSGKPQPSGERFTTYFFADDFRLARGYDRDAWGGVSPTVVGELYWHFGWVGVVVGLYLLGRIGKFIYSTFQRNINNKSVLLVYAILYTSFAMFAEALQGYVNGLVMYSIVIFFSLLILTARLLPVKAQKS